MNVRDEQHTAARLTQPSANGFLVVIEQGGFINLHKAFELLRSFAFGHEQREAVSQRTLADAIGSYQQDVTVDRLGEDVDQVAEQAFAEVDGFQLAGLCASDEILRRAVGANDLRRVAKNVIDGFGRDAVLAEQATGADSAFSEDEQNVISIDADFVLGVGGAERIVDQNDGLAGERYVPVARRDKVEVAVLIAAAFDG